MNVFHIIYVIFGIVLGVLVTFRLRNAFKNDLESSGGKVIVNSPSIDLLKEEKQLLLNRLREIDAVLGVDKEVKPVVDTPSPTFSPSTVVYLNTPDVLKPATIVTTSPMETKISASHKTEPKSTSSFSSDCPYDFKVYVYDIPSELNSVRYSEEARKNQSLHVCHRCILEQFSLEYIMLDFFTQFCGRTMDPEEADFFYLPIVRDAEFRVAQALGGKNRAPSNTENALISVLEKNDASLWKDVFKVTDKYWNRNGGGDHIIVMPAPVTNLRHESSMRGFFHYMIQLHTPIFLNLEYSIDFVKEYPICSSLKNIVAPYPTIDPELYNGKLHYIKGTRIPRTSLIYYAGGMHGDCVEVRKAMKFLMSNSTLLKNNIVPNFKSNLQEREHGFLAATFCPIPIGDSPSSKRMYDVLNFGCIPVILSDDLVWAFSDQTGGPLNHNEFSFQIPQSVVHFTAQKTLRRFADNREGLGKLPSGLLIYDLLEESVKEGGDYQEGRYVNPLVQILLKVPQKDIDHLQKGVEKAAPYYRYYQMNSTLSHIPTSQHQYPNGGAIETIAQLLSNRKKYGLTKLRDDCQRERSAKNHKYVGKYTCDADKSESLVRRVRYVFR